MPSISLLIFSAILPGNLSFNKRISLLVASNLHGWNNMYTEFIRNTSKLAEYWLDPLSKSWSGQYKDKVKVE
jgi:hypothetical protein